MRLLLAIFILSFLAPAVHADGQQADGEATLSSWATESGFNKRTDEESAAAKFLREVRPEEFQHASKKQQSAADNQAMGGGTR